MSEPRRDQAEQDAACRQACGRLHKALEILRHRFSEVYAMQAKPTGVKWSWWAGECLQIQEYVVEAYDLIAGLTDPVEILDEMSDL